MALFTPTASEVSSFAEGMCDMYDFARSTEPDVAVFPLRGAYPFSRAYSTIASLNNEKVPDMLLLPLGTNRAADTRLESGITKPQKKRIIEEELGGYLDGHPDARRIFLVDEVQKGGTILTHSSMIRHMLYQRFRHRNIALEVCAIEGRKLFNPSPRYPGAAVRHHFHRVQIENLFTMDREQFLPSIERRDGDEFHVDINNGAAFLGVLDEIQVLRARCREVLV